MLYAIKYRCRGGALINRENSAEHYGIFECIPGTSIRIEASGYINWPNVPENLRQFYGKVHTTIDELAKRCVDEGLEPWDIGIHQAIYSVDPEKREITLGLVDTEEFNFTSDGTYWPASFYRIGIPALLMEELTFRNAYED